MNLRDQLLSIWDMIGLAQRVGFTKWRDVDTLVHYATTQVWSRRRRTPMNVPESIAAWTEVIVVLSTAHCKEDIDAAEFRMDELLTPLLAAPVADLRAFHRGLTEALQTDERVPFFIWSMFNAWGKEILEKAEAKPAARKLRRKLAAEIADMVDEDVRPDISKAITGALMWRDPKTLGNIKADLEAGAKPKLVGKESCLFLTTKRPGRGAPQHQVML